MGKVKTRDNVKT